MRFWFGYTLQALKKERLILGLVIGVLGFFVIADFVLLFVISRIPSFISLTVAECLSLPLSIFLFHVVLLKAVGFETAPVLISLIGYVLVSSMLFAVITWRKQGWVFRVSILVRSVGAAIVFSALHFLSFGLMLWLLRLAIN
jgi:hypothetical protein